MAAEPLSKEVLGDWMFSVTLLLAGVGAALALLVTDRDVGGAVASLAMMGWWLVLARLVFRRLKPAGIIMSDSERVRLGRLLKLTTVVSAVGYAGVIVLSVLNAPVRVSWLPIWPGVALGILCGARSLMQLSRATQAARRTR